LFSGILLVLIKYMKKQTKSFLWLGLIALGLIVCTLWILAPKAAESPVENGEEEATLQVRRVVKEFMEEAYIKENYQKASGLYVPPVGFETFLSMEPMALEEYIEWYVRSVNLASLGVVTNIQIREVEMIEDNENSFENTTEELYKVTFYFMKEDGEPVYFGPCCGEEGAPSPEMFTRVIETENGYKIFEDLPYRP
jgi:hypothetical protein